MRNQRKRPAPESDAEDATSPATSIAEPTCVVLASPDFVLDSLLEARLASEGALAELLADALVIGGPEPSPPVEDPSGEASSEDGGSEFSNAAAEPPLNCAQLFDSDLSSDEEGSIFSSTGADFEDPGPSGSHRNGGAPPSPPPRKRQRTKKQPQGEQPLKTAAAGDGQPLKRSTRNNRKRRHKRKQAEARRKALLRSLLEKALKYTRELDLQALPHASTSYLGTQSKKSKPTVASDSPMPHEDETDPPPDSQVHPRVQELLAQGYTVVDSHSAPDLIFDGGSRLGAWKPGAFGQPGYWDKQIQGLSKSFEKFRKGISEARSKQKRRGKTGGGTPRGQHTWTKWGYSLGGGEKEPMSTAQLNRKERSLWLAFLACPFFKEVTERLMESFETWAPDVYKKYDGCHKYILSQLKALDCINPQAPASVPFAAITANLGPQTVCWPHQDIKNLANGACIILVLGAFNHRYGGHIVLHEPRLILEMKPGDAVYLPSAVITHETIPIQDGETRYSLVFYSAGGLFRWQDCASRSKKEFAAQDKEAFDRHFSTAKSKERWAAGWSCFPTLEELRENAKSTSKSAPEPSAAAPASAAAP